MPLNEPRVTPVVYADGRIGVKSAEYDIAGNLIPDPSWLHHLAEVRTGKFEQKKEK